MKYSNLIIILATLLSFSCKDKCAAPKDVYYNIIQSDLDRVPYTGYDTLTFLRNEADTQKFYGSGKKKYFTVTDGYIGGCPPDHWNFEGYSINYINNQNNLIVNLYNYGQGACAFDVTFSKVKFSRPSVSLGKPYSFDSLEISGKLYKNITNLAYSGADSAYYNTTYGILKFRFSSGEKWELIKTY